MANILKTPVGIGEIAKVALLLLKNNLVMPNTVYTEYKKEFGYKKGDTVNVRKPARFLVTDGAAASIQDIVETTVPIVVDKQRHVDFAITSKERTLDLRSLADQVIEPAMSVLANDVDVELCKLYIDLFHTVGSAGTTPATFADIGLAGEMLDLHAVPVNKKRFMVLNPTARWAMADSLKGVYDDTRVREILGEAYLGNLGQFKMLSDQNVRRHTKGVATGTPLSNGVAQTGANIVTDGWTISVTGILLKGDIIRFAGVNSVNPVSKADTGKLANFVVTADVNSSGTGAATIPISPAIVTSGATQNVTNAVADNSAITVIGNHIANMAYHKNTFALVEVPLDLPEGAVHKAREIDPDTGLSIRVVADYDFNNDRDLYRCDILFGVKTIYPDLGCRLLG